MEFFPRQSHENKIGEGKYLKKGEAKGVKYLEKENIWPTELKEKEEHIQRKKNILPMKEKERGGKYLKEHLVNGDE